MDTNCILWLDMEIAGLVEEDLIRVLRAGGP